MRVHLSCADVPAGADGQQDNQVTGLGGTACDHQGANTQARLSANRVPSWAAPDTNPEQSPREGVCASAAGSEAGDGLRTRGIQKGRGTGLHAHFGAMEEGGEE